MMHTETFVPTLSMYLLRMAWLPRVLLLGSLNMQPATRTCCHPCLHLSPSTTSSVPPFGLHGTRRSTLIMLRLLRLGQGSCSLTLMHLPLFPLLGHWMTLALLWLLCCPLSLILLGRALAPSPRSLFPTLLPSILHRGGPQMMTFMLRKLSFTLRPPHFRKTSSCLLATLV